MLKLNYNSKVSTSRTVGKKDLVNGYVYFNKYLYVQFLSLTFSPKDVKFELKNQSLSLFSSQIFHYHPSPHAFYKDAA
ncbi:MAG: hypothetical protein LBV23_05680 [Deltaproteobacteria bacterium]|jgi:hypothetical protein|nr:hypothetical protein [Deltaproteobacteria bacterium]